MGRFELQLSCILGQAPRRLGFSTEPHEMLADYVEPSLFTTHYPIEYKIAAESPCIYPLLLDWCLAAMLISIILNA